MSDIFRFEGKVAVVTGSTRGWGKGCAKGLAERGARVVINGVTEQNVNEVVAEIRASGGQAVPAVESVATMKGAERIIKTAVDSFGRIDILVNCAGGLHEKTIITDMTEEQWDNMIAIQLKGVFACTKCAAIEMIKQGSGGRILSIAGGAGVRGMYGDSAHAASKGGVISAIMSWALELESYGITVNAVRGTVRSKGSSPVMEEMKQQLKAMGKPVPAAARELGFFEPEEAAVLLVWLASEDAKDITGQFIGIDGSKVVLWSYAQPHRTVHLLPQWTPESLSQYFKPVVQADSQKNRGVAEVSTAATTLGLEKDLWGG